MTSHSSDDGFHEIQLNGKQLVFLFMAVTVVSVVIFLCGVMFGRGARIERAAAAQAIADAASTEILPAPPLFPAQPAGGQNVRPDPAISDNPVALRSASPDTNAPVDEVKPAPPEPAPAPRTAAPETRPAPVAAVKAETPPVAAGAPTASAGSGFVVQVAALNVRSEAEANAKRLAARGYTAYVESPTSGSPGVFRVRVGPFKTRRDADAVAAKLRKEDRISPWVVSR